MSVSIFLVLVLFLSSSCASPLNDNCTSMARSGDCDFYSQCVEKHIPCGPDGYALGYAGKYCVKFGKYADCFNEGVYRTKYLTCIISGLPYCTGIYFSS